MSKQKFVCNREFKCYSNSKGAGFQLNRVKASPSLLCWSQDQGCHPVPQRLGRDCEKRISLGIRVSHLVLGCTHEHQPRKTLGQVFPFLHVCILSARGTRTVGLSFPTSTTCDCEQGSLLFRGNNLCDPRNGAAAVLVPSLSLVLSGHGEPFKFHSLLVPKFLYV